jgi:YbbR domain-containing protein
VKVIPIIIGDPAKGHRIKFFAVEPQGVIIEGIEAEIKKFNSLQTEPIDITGISETLLQDVKLDLTGKNIRANVNDVRVKIVIGESKT